MGIGRVLSIASINYQLPVLCFYRVEYNPQRLENPTRWYLATFQHTPTCSGVCQKIRCIQILPSPHLSSSIAEGWRWGPELPLQPRGCGPKFGLVYEHVVTHELSESGSNLPAGTSCPQGVLRTSPWPKGIVGHGVLHPRPFFSSFFCFAIFYGTYIGVTYESKSQSTGRATILRFPIQCIMVSS